MIKILGLTLVLGFSQGSNAADIIQVRCNKLLTGEKTFFSKFRGLFVNDDGLKFKEVKLSGGLRTGDTSLSLKQGVPSLAIYYNLKNEKFVSSDKREDHLLEIKYLTEGKVLIPGCSGPVFTVLKAHID